MRVVSIFDLETILTSVTSCTTSYEVWDTLNKFGTHLIRICCKVATNQMIMGQSTVMHIIDSIEDNESNLVEVEVILPNSTQGYRYYLNIVGACIFQLQLDFLASSKVRGS